MTVGIGLVERIVGLGCSGVIVAADIIPHVNLWRFIVGKALRIQPYVRRIHKIVVSNCVALPG